MGLLNLKDIAGFPRRAGRVSARGHRAIVRRGRISEQAPDEPLGVEAARAAAFVVAVLDARGLNQNLLRNTGAFAEGVEHGFAAVVADGFLSCLGVEQRCCSRG